MSDDLDSPGDTGVPSMLRPEARPISYAELDERQRACFDYVVALLRAAVGRDRLTIDADQRESRPYLDYLRATTTVMVGGERSSSAPRQYPRCPSCPSSGATPLIRSYTVRLTDPESDQNHRQRTPEVRNLI